MRLDAREPSGPVAEKWDRHKFEMKLVNPANKRKYTIIVVGTGLAGGSAAASSCRENLLDVCWIGRRVIANLFRGIDGAEPSHKPCRDLTASNW